MTTLDAIRALRAQGQHEAARTELLLLASAHPTDPAVQYATACVHDFLGYERAAVPFYRAAIEHGLSGADLRGAYLGLGSTYRALGEYAAAQSTLLAGLALFPDAPELRVFLALTSYNLGAHAAAVAALLHLLADTSADPDIQSYARAIHFYAEHLDERWE